MFLLDHAQNHHQCPARCEHSSGVTEDWLCCPLLTRLIEVPLSAFPQHSIGPGGRAAFLAGVVVLREQVVFVGGRKIQLAFDEAPENLERVFACIPSSFPLPKKSVRIHTAHHFDIVILHK